LSSRVDCRRRDGIGVTADLLPRAAFELAPGMDFRDVGQKRFDPLLPVRLAARLGRQGKKGERLFMARQLEVHAFQDVSVVSVFLGGLDDLSGLGQPVTREGLAQPSSPPAPRQARRGGLFQKLGNLGLDVGDWNYQSLPAVEWSQPLVQRRLDGNNAAL